MQIACSKTGVKKKVLQVYFFFFSSPKKKQLPLYNNAIMFDKILDQVVNDLALQGDKGYKE